MKGEGAVAEEKVRSLFREHFFDMEGEIKAPAITPMTETLQQAIRRRQEKHRLLDQLPKKDCAACGAPDCTTLAEDVLAGQADLSDCVSDGACVRIQACPAFEEITIRRSAPSRKPVVALPTSENPRKHCFQSASTVHLDRTDCSTH